MLTKRKRKKLLLITILLFIIVSGAVLFYSLGYRVGPGWQIQKTGGVFIHASVAGARVLVDGRTQKNTSLLAQNALVKNLIPGTHEIKVEKEGFWSWQKILVIAPEIVASRDVLLVPKEPVVSSVATTTLEHFPHYFLSKHIIFQNENSKPKLLFVGVERFWELPQSSALLIFGEDGNFYKNNKQLTVATSSTETFLDLPPEIANILISLLKIKKNLIFDDAEERVIYWDAHTVGSYWIGETEKMPQWQKTRSISILTFPGEIKNVVTYPEHSDYLILEIGSGIWALEIDNVGGQNLVPVYQGKDPKIITKSSNTLIVFDNNQYITIELP